jgi:hypothetical protein
MPRGQRNPTNRGVTATLGGGGVLEPALPMRTGTPAANSAFGWPGVIWRPSKRKRLGFPSAARALGCQPGSSRRVAVASTTTGGQGRGQGGGHRGRLRARDGKGGTMRTPKEFAGRVSWELDNVALAGEAERRLGTGSSRQGASRKPPCGPSATPPAPRSAWVCWTGRAAGPGRGAGRPIDRAQLGAATAGARLGAATRTGRGVHVSGFGKMKSLPDGPACAARWAKERHRC